jgi:hypothetical protein
MDGETIGFIIFMVGIGGFYLCKEWASAGNEVRRSA